MAYIEINNENQPVKILKTDADKTFWMSLNQDGSTVNITDAQFNKIQLGRQSLPDCTDVNNIVWSPEITNSSTIDGNDGNTYNIIVDITKDSLNSWVALFKDKWKNQNQSWAQASDVNSFITWLDEQVDNDWSGTTFPISNKTIEEVISDKYTGTFYSLLQI